MGIDGFWIPHKTPHRGHDRFFIQDLDRTDCLQKWIALQNWLQEAVQA